jgi:hypothetical protein
MNDDSISGLALLPERNVNNGLPGVSPPANIRCASGAKRKVLGKDKAYTRATDTKPL